MNRAGQRDTRDKEDVPDRMERIVCGVEATRDDFWSSRCEEDMPYDGGSGEAMKVFRENEQFQLAMDKAWSTLAGNAEDVETVHGMEGEPDSAGEEGSLLDGSETVMQADTEASEAREGDKEKWNVSGLGTLKLPGSAETYPTLGEKIREVGRRILSQREELGPAGRGDYNKKIRISQRLGSDSALESLIEASARPVYGECRRNLAADKGTIAFDGCGEFLAAGEVGSSDAFKCAACSCHRNFHRRLIDEQDETDHVTRHEATESEDSNLVLSVKRLARDVKVTISQVLPLLAADLQKKGKERELFSSESSFIVKKCLEVMEHNAKLMLAATECLSSLQVGTRDVREKSLQGLPALTTPGDASSAVKEGRFTSQALIPVRITGNSMRQISTVPEVRLPTSTHVHTERQRKRKRTKFTVEQLEKLHTFAERVKWTLSGLRKEEIESACSDIGVEAITLRYWLHNSKQKSKRKNHDEGGSCSRSAE